VGPDAASRGCCSVPALGPAEIKPLRYRLNQLINDRMRNILFDL
jgi:hypothetical protein